MATKFRLRPHQKGVVGKVASAYKQGVLSGIAGMATGTGKTPTACYIGRSIREKGDDRPMLVLMHKEDLVDQWCKAIEMVMPGASIGVEMAANVASPGNDVIIASVPTVGRQGSDRLGWAMKRSFSSVHIDEAHHAAATGYYNVVDRLGHWEGKTFIVGWTATSHRLDKKVLVDPSGRAIFQQQFCDYGLVPAIKDGVLCDVRAYQVRSGTNLKGVATSMGDFNQNELSKRVNQTVRTQKAYERWKELAGDRPTVIFCVDIEHATQACSYWRMQGESATVVHSKTDILSKEERRHRMRAWKSGNIQCLFNVGIATEGVDYPACSCAVMLRPTLSWVLYMQMLGRITRIHEGKEDAIVIDVVDNSEKHAVSAPSAVGLPDGVDMEGKTLEEGIDIVERAARRGQQIKDKQSLTDLTTSVREINLLAQMQQIRDVPPEVASGSIMNWLKVGEHYVLPAGATGTRETGIREIFFELVPDLLGNWHMKKNGEPIVDLGRGDVPDFKRVDAVLSNERDLPKSSLNIMTRDAEWRVNEITDKQRNILRKVPGMTEEDMNGLTRGEASNLIGLYFQQKKEKREARTARRGATGTRRG